MIVREYTSRDALFAHLAAVIAEELMAALQISGKATLSVPGGTTPGPVFDALSQADLDWSRVAVVLNDERWVPEDNLRSNTRLLRERLFVNRAAGAQLVPLYVPGLANPDDALAELADGLRPYLPLTVCLLGMGADMHTASLFPGADRLAEALSPDAPLVLPLRADAAGEPRITLTAPVLQAARHVHILITGQEKRRALTTALTLPPTEAPVRVVLETATVHWAE